MTPELQDPQVRFGRLQMLWQDADRTFYRASRDEPGGTRRTVMLVRPTSEDPAAGILDRLAHAYNLRSYLDAPWAVRPLDLVREHGRTTLVLEDPGAEPLDRLLGAPMEIGKFLRLAEALAATVRSLHERDLIHKDINPSNILVDDSASQLWLMGFGRTSHVPRERQQLILPEFIPGSLPYMSPEQTGRMNRSIDSRSDLYSLGVTLYQMSTGALPFAAHEPMEWVHCHIAQTPLSPRERVETIPAPISKLVVKLLAKTAEDRYQTAAGVEHDLRRCRAEWETRGHIEDFDLARHDLLDRLLIPEKLYGRGREVTALLDSFRHVVVNGASGFVLISGYSGIGKSSVVHELHKVIPPRGLFASGKFEQHKRDIPYATVAQALQSLVRQILSKSENELQVWRNTLRDTLSPNARLIVDMIPELELVIGEQPAVPDLPPQDTQRRFHSVLRRFIGAFARQQHPLVLFLDDLQWLDAATLDLLEDILTQRDIRHLLLIGAYRDNEVDATHPLMRKLDAIRRAGALVHDIVLAPLSHRDLEQLVADSLHCEPAHASSLVRLVEEKTSGNPFFVIQFISALFEEELLIFDHIQGQWRWDLTRIHTKGYADNVVDLMVERLVRLPPETQQALQQLSCIGNNADFATLRAIYHDFNEEMHGSLWEAVRTGLICRSGDSYRFLHDRVQEAAYSLIPEDRRAEAHLRIGLLMTSQTSPAKLEEDIFEIVNQLNRGSHLIASTADHERIAGLNLIAGRRARNSSAYASALNYLHAGRELLTEATWNDNYDLIFSIEYLLAECELLTTSLADAEKRLAMLAQRAGSDHDIARVTRLRLTLYDVLGRTDRAVEVFVGYQRAHGHDWSPHPTDEELRREYDRIWRLIGERKIDQFVDLPLVSDPHVLDVLDVLDAIVMPAMFTDVKLHTLVVCRIVSLSLQHGNSDAACFAFVSLGMLAGPVFGNYDAGFRLGRLGYDVVEKHGLQRSRARVYARFGNCILPWQQHVKTGQELQRRALDAATRSGDFTFAAYSYNYLLTNLLAVGDSLAEAQREAETGLAFASKVVFGPVVKILEAQLAYVKMLRGLTATFGSLDDGGFDEIEVELDAAKPNWPLAACRYWTQKLQARYFAGDYASAVQSAANAERYLSTSYSFFEIAEYHFYGALSQAGAFDSATEHARPQHLKALAGHHKQLGIWANNCPENFENRVALVGAEIARIEGRDLDAIRLYEQAIRSAGDHGFVHNEALACETAARFYAARGLDTSARLFLERARDCYVRWGADGKVRQLEALYPWLASADPRIVTREPSKPEEQLDVAAVVKASQALSGEMLLPRLIERLMTIAVQNAGADRGLLILPYENDYRIEAEARADGERIILHYGAAAAAAVPENLIRYVMRTQESVILDDAARQNLFSEDPYFGRERQRSILCIPLIRQGALVGLLYLENRLSSHVFTSDRARVLELLASQAAISLENTRLYGDLRERELKIRRLVDANIIGVLTIGPDDRIIEANDAFLRMVGYERDDLASGRVRSADLTPPEWRVGDAKRADEVESTGTVQPFEKEYLRKDGSRVPVLVGLARVDEGGNQAVAFVVDLTERKRAAAELAHANRVATMGQLTASIAHEVNQPLAALLTNAETSVRWLAHRPPNLEKARPLIDRIIGDGRRAADIVRRIRNFSQKAVVQEAELELNEIILEITTLARAAVSDHGVLVKMQLSEGLPHVLGDRIQLQQVILNLIMNAIEAMSEVPDGARDLLIRTREAEPGSVCVEIRDSGPGLPSGNPDRIFEAFYTTKANGLGMGLSICRSIVEAHGGRLWATPNEPQGAVFCMALPNGGKHVSAMAPGWES